jgi:O-6-methylguanine DNA methyltransferase
MKTFEPVSLPIATPEGEFIARYSTAGLAALEFPSDGKALKKQLAPASVRPWHERTTAAVKAVLSGRAPAAMPPLDLSAGTPFQQRVWAELRRIKPGETRSYGELAAALGKPGAARAVGGACGANPIPVLVPCHRVLAAHRKLGGFSGGLHWKRRLLAREGL